jgi:hypothetical protein
MRKFSLTDFLIINDPTCRYRLGLFIEQHVKLGLLTMTSAPPVAYDGMDAKIGAKKIEMKNAKPAVIAVIPVFPPSVTEFNNSLDRVVTSTLTTDARL